MASCEMASSYMGATVVNVRTWHLVAGAPPSRRLHSPLVPFCVHRLSERLEERVLVESYVPSAYFGTAHQDPSTAQTGHPERSPLAVTQPDSLVV